MVIYFPIMNSAQSVKLPSGKENLGVDMKQKIVKLQYGEKENDLVDDL